MKLRQRTLLCVALTLGCLLAGVYILSSKFILNEYRNLEQRETIRNVNRVTDELAYQIKEMHSNSSDWSNWDDTYQFMADRNAAYVRSNLDTVLLNLDLMVFLDSNGRVVYSKPLPKKGKAAPPLAEEVRSALGFDKSVVNPLSELNGLVTLASGDTLLVSVRPIVRTSGVGPPRGWTVFALRMDSAEVKGLGDRSHLKLGLFGFKDQADPPDCQVMSAALTNGGIRTRALSDTSMAGYAVLSDVFGRAVKLLRVENPRDIFAQGLRSQRYLLLFILGAGFVFGILVLGVIEYATLSRLSRLSSQVDQIGLEGEETARIVLPGRDEISWLAAKIDGMVEILRERKQELRKKNDELVSSVNLLAATNHILANAVEGIAEVNDEDQVVRFNHAFAAMHGYDEGQFTAFHWQTLIAPSDQETVHDAILMMIAEGKAVCEACGRRRDGSLFFEEIVIVAALDAQSRVASCHWFTKDITERKQLEAQIKHKAYHDVLTGLPNRDLLVDRLRTACQRARRKASSIAVLFLDLDEFKAVNDSLGHEAGDFLLKGVAERIRSCVREGDTVARLGGDEFTVLLEGLDDPKQAVLVAERIVTRLKSPISLPNGKVFANVSIGIAYSENGAHEAETLLRDADTAMYQAKDKTKPCFALFDPSMNVAASEKRELAAQLNRALTTDELQLLYQPLVALDTGRPVGVESLIHWPERPFFKPTADQIVVLAEEAGFIDALFSWMLTSSCRQMRAWLPYLDERIQLHIKVSCRELQHPDLIETIDDILRETRMPPQRLRIEVPSKALVADQERTLKRLTELSTLGISLVLDNFGTGSHFVSKLGDYPFHMVKVDASVIGLLDSHEEARALTQATLIMANSAKVLVTAEGVETLGQLLHARDLGCSVGQGSIFGRPLGPREVLPRLSGGVVLPVSTDKAATDQAA